MIVIYICFIILTTIWVLLFEFEIITTVTSILLLYVSSILLAVASLIKECFPFIPSKEKNEAPVADIKPPPAVDIVNYSPPKRSDLFIDRWKKKFTDNKPQFPLDRLAYLNAKYYDCPREKCFILKTSQQKQLVQKTPSCEDIRRDDPHPNKLVTDLSSTYIHRRAAFFRKRSVGTADGVQRTIPRKVTSLKETERFNYTPKFVRVVSPDADSSPESEELSADVSCVRKGSIWKRLSRLSFSFSTRKGSARKT